MKFGSDGFYTIMESLANYFFVKHQSFHSRIEKRGKIRPGLEFLFFFFFLKRLPFCGQGPISTDIGTRRMQRRNYLIVKKIYMILEYCHMDNS